ncbi:MAG: Sulfur carrier protein ThiS adenylyltransferase [Pseudomonadota bacterium]
MQVELAPYVQAGFRGETLILGAGRCKITISEDSEKSAFKSVLKYFLDPRSKDDIERDLSGSKNLMKAYERLRDSALLMSSSDISTTGRYSRNALFFSLMGEAQPSRSQQRLSESTVAVIGCGGIGNAVALQLATAGVGRMFLVDFDTIELSNLTRQFVFKEQHVGEKKIEVLARELSERNSGIDIYTTELDLSEENATSQLPDANLWVLSADSPSELLFWVNRESVLRNIPYINVGYCADIAIWGPLVVPKQTGCHECSKVYASFKSDDPSFTELLKKVNGRHRPASSGPINQMAAALAARDIMNFLTGVGEVHSLNQRLGFYTHSLEIQKQNFSRSLSCEVCSPQ